ncbi:unnamed protein product, partial [Scytosiphon promiscuus]
RNLSGSWRVTTPTSGNQYSRRLRVTTPTSVRLEVGRVLDHLIDGPHERANDPLQGVELVL